MFLQRLLNQGNAPLLEQVVRFTSARHKLLAENIANADTVDYVQRDLSEEKFQELLSRRLEERRSAPPGSVGFADIVVDPENPEANILFHDGNNRSKEQLMSAMASNALKHNMAIELLRRQYESLEAALRERLS